MPELRVSCPVCGHPVRKHNDDGCSIREGRFDSCWCTQTPADINPPEPPVDEPVEYALPPAKPSDEDLVPDVAEPVVPDVDEDLALMREAGLTFTPDQRVVLVDDEVPEPDPEPSPAADLRPPPPRHGQVLGWWDAFYCLACGSRFFLPRDCCDKATVPVTVTVAFREVADAQR